MVNKPSPAAGGAAKPPFGGPVCEMGRVFGRPQPPGADEGLAPPERAGDSPVRRYGQETSMLWRCWVSKITLPGGTLMHQF
jgi:hypothetical protein